MKRTFIISIIVGFFSLFPLCACQCAMAAEPPKDPILRIETGMHTAAINRISVDVTGRRLVTASDDKTIRIWALPSGRLERIIRPPVGEGDAGKLHAVAISPDGKTLACGGWTNFNDAKKASASDGYRIYLFSAVTGRLIRCLTGLHNVICHLVFSRDNRFLAATMMGRSGLRVFRLVDGREIASDKNYGGRSYSADFDALGRLATTCLDGYIRLYDQQFRLISKKKISAGKNPYIARFSPDGERIAVGFVDSTKVILISGRDLTFLTDLDTAGVNNGNLGSVAWSTDGKFLYAGGRYDRQQHNPIRTWSQTGRWSYQDFRVGAKNTIMDLAPLPDGSLAFGSADPAFGIVSFSNQATLFAGPAIVEHRDNLDSLLIAKDGAAVQFAYEYGGRSPARFNVPGRLLDMSASTAVLLTPPRTKALGLTVTDWENEKNPKLNGRPMKLNQYERSRCLAIAHDETGFVLGTSWMLHAYDRSGNERWRSPIPATTRSVNIAGDGRVAVAAFGDGTIRWYRMTDGKELLAFFPHKDRKRWVMWTPGGYYDASPGGEELIGWHLNQGKDQAADFYPASRFRSSYYRPDVTARIIETLDEGEALSLADEESGRRYQKKDIKTILPPVVTILSPGDGSSIYRPELTVSYAVRNPSGEPVTAIRVLLDGRPVSTQRGLTIKSKKESTHQIQVSIPERDIEISIIAENRHAASVPSTIRLHWQGKIDKEQFLIKPKLYVLAVGVSNYKDSGLTLGFASKDAEDFAKSMERQKDGLYRDVAVRVLIDRQATRDEIMDGLEWIQTETTSKDIAMVFLAGHGVNDQAGIYYYLPVNADTEKLKRTGVSFSEIKNTITSLAGKAILFADTCHSGNVMGTRRGVADINAVVNELASAENGVVVFASSTGKQYSLEDKTWGNGAFTKALVEGLSGQADYHGKGKITINMLDLYLSERVKELTGGKQTPTTTKPQTIPDFPVAMKR